MKMVFLGTSAGEQYPGFWCHCENCEKARRLGGKNRRKNSCVWIAADTMIDFPAETFMQAERYGIEPARARYVLFTHSHEDHFFPYVFGWRRMPKGMQLPPPKNLAGPRFSEVTPIHIYGNEKVCAGIGKWVRGDLTEYALELTRVEAFHSYEIGPMRVTPVLANHPDGDQRGLNYIVHREGKTFFYGLDTGWFLDESYREIARHRYDLVVMEGTFGFGAEAECHMNLRKLVEAHRRFEKDGLLNPKALFCASHLCPHFTPVHDEVAPVMAKDGITVAYDGMVVEL